MKSFDLASGFVSRIASSRMQEKTETVARGPTASQKAGIPTSPHSRMRVACKSLGQDGARDSVLGASTPRAAFNRLD